MNNTKIENNQTNNNPTDWGKFIFEQAKIITDVYIAGMNSGKPLGAKEQWDELREKENNASIED